MYRKFFKRLIDVTASAAVLILASPVLAAVAVLLHFSMREPVYSLPRNVPG